MTPTEALNEAIKRAGSKRRLALGIGIKHQAIYQWTDRCPPERVLAIERETGVSRHDLRPDIYPIETRKRAS